MSIEALKKNWIFSIVVLAAVLGFLTVMNKSHKKSATATDKQPADWETFYTEEEAKSCISAPIEGLNIPYTIYEVLAEKGGIFDFKTGSQFTIPKNAFVDENGNQLKGKVELRYREFHDVLDFFVAGIPMTYDSAGVRYHFESAGMMEMKAYQNGKQVFIAPDKFIDVALASNYRGAHYNLYQLDTLKNNWSCLGKDRVVDSSVNSDKPKNTIAEKIPELKEIEEQKQETKKEKESKIAALAKLKSQPTPPAKANKQKYVFNIDVDPKEFPELAVFKSVIGISNTTSKLNAYFVCFA